MSFFPSRDAMKSLIHLVEAAPEAARYLYQRFVVMTGNSQPELSNALETFATSVERQHTVSANPFAGDKVPLPQENLERQASPPPPAPKMHGTHHIQLDINIHPNSAMDRFYRINDQTIGKNSTSDFLDGLFKQWFASHNIKRSQGIMYHVDASGQSKPISPQTLETLLNDPQAGIATFIRNKTQDAYHISQVNVMHSVPAPAEEPNTTMSGGR